MRTTVVALIVIWLCPLFGLGAQNVALPKEGRQFLLVGFDVGGGPLVKNGSRENSYLQKTTHLKIGIQQQINESFFMNISVAGGLAFLPDHTFVEGSPHEATIRPDWDVLLDGRWFPFGDYNGWFGGVGLNWHTTSAKAASLHTFGPRLTTGHYIWPNTEAFVALALFYTYPAISGLSATRQFGQNAPSLEGLDAHRVGFSVSYGF